MNNALIGDFKVAATEIIALVFPKTGFKVLCQEIGVGNIAITFHNSKQFSDNFRIKYYVKLETLIISGYSSERTVHLIYQATNNYTWRNECGVAIDKPSCLGEKLEFLARKFFLVLQEFYLGEVFDSFSILPEFENKATSFTNWTCSEFNQN